MDYLTTDELLTIASVELDNEKGFGDLNRRLRNLGIRGMYRQDAIMLSGAEMKLANGKYFSTKKRLDLFNEYKNEMYRQSYLMTVWNILSFWQLSESDIIELTNNPTAHFHQLKRLGIFIGLPKKNMSMENFLKLIAIEAASAREMFYVDSSRGAISMAS